MKFLLDTHVFLWWVFDKQTNLTQQVMESIATAEELYLSLASIWEISIKSSLGKLQLRKPIAQFMTEHLTKNRIDILLIEFAHVVDVSKLPFHHRDPFDRLLIAQSMHKGLPIISNDQAFDAYPVVRIWT